MKRFHWLAGQVKKRGFKYGAEIGVKKGNTTHFLLRTCPDLVLFAVDLWGPQPNKDNDPTIERYNSWDHGKIYKLFESNIRHFRSRVFILQGFSTEVCDLVRDANLDFVFIDGDHTYFGCLADLVSWTPKVRVGGMIAGHDIHFPGVYRAVQEYTQGCYTEVGIDHCWFYEKTEAVIPTQW